MRIEIDLLKLVEKKVSLDGYLVCYLLQHNQTELLTQYVKECGKITTILLDKLVELGYICKINDTSPDYKISNIKVTDLFAQDFQAIPDPLAWVDIWFDLWPKGIKSGGYYIRTDKEACEKKLKTFMRKHPEYNKGIIIAATKAYIAEMQRKGYAYMKLAPYFVEKDQVSMLDGYCQKILASVNGQDEEFNTTGENDI